MALFTFLYLEAALGLLFLFSRSFFHHTDCSLFSVVLFPVVLAFPELLTGAPFDVSSEGVYRVYLLRKKHLHNTDCTSLRILLLEF